mmetsp:Transcript_5127/g.760  ORF Transcript_5127/g.760 Transcript_5127/m.760 type:complete len:112 (+) Transcript_5127:206-541(+)
MKPIEDDFLVIYKKKYPQHKSYLIYNQGQGELTLKGKKRNFKITCTTYQMIILFRLLENKEGIEHKKLQELTGINPAEFDFNLFFLVKGTVALRENKESKKKNVTHRKNFP